MKIEIELTPAQLEQIRIAQGWQLKPTLPTPTPTPEPMPEILSQTYLRGDGNVQRANVGGLKNLGPMRATLTENQMKEVLALGFRLAKWPLAMPRERTLSTAWKNGVKQTAQMALEYGIKLAIRPQYHQRGMGFVPDMALIEAHIPQMGELFADIRPALAYTEAGYLGAWAEWHSDVLIRLPDGSFHHANAGRVFSLINQHYPADLHRCVRYAKALVRQDGNRQGFFQWNESGQPFQNLWNIHNDFYANGGQDASTFWPDRGSAPLSADDRRMQNEQRSYVYRMAQSTYYVGEPDRGDNRFWDDGTAPLSRAALLTKVKAEGLSALNLDGRSLMRQWMQREPALYRELLVSLGYNLHAERVTFEPREGKRFKLTINWVNTGSSGMLNPTNLELLIGDVAIPVADGINKGLPVGGKSETTTHLADLPDLKAGKYRLGLRLRDLAGSDKFCTQLNNRGMAFVNGVNDLDMILEV
jgi:hypothetical protein